MPIDVYLNVAVSGVLTGLVYGLMALGLSVIFGVVRVVNAGMEKAIRVVSIERGYDPRGFALVAFGGCGGFVLLCFLCCGGVAWFAHIGGFLAGCALIGLFKRRTVPWGWQRYRSF